MSKKIFLATALVVLAATAGAGIVFAAGSAIPGRGGPSASLDPEGTRTGLSTGSGCGRVWQTKDDPFYPDSLVGEDDFSDLTPAMSITALKRCLGDAVVTFSSETWNIEEEGNEVEVANHWDDILVTVRATCIAPTSLVSQPCHAGDVAWAFPGGEPDDPVYFDTEPQEGGSVHSMQWVFPHLKGGTWRFDVIPGSPDDDPDNGLLWYRTLSIETL